LITSISFLNKTIFLTDRTYQASFCWMKNLLDKENILLLGSINERKIYDHTMHLRKTAFFQKPSLILWRGRRREEKMNNFNLTSLKANS